MTTTEADAATDVYVTTLRVDEMFIDPEYQRILEVARARKIASTWNRRLAGIIEVSDRGADLCPRYAVMDGQHRVAAAGFLTDPPVLVVKVHEGLSVAEEADLFDKLNRNRKQTNTFDNWKARRVAGDSDVLDIERVVRRNGLEVVMSPSDGHVACVSTLEKVVKLGGLDLLHQTISLIVEVWGPRRDGLDSPVIQGLALVLWYLAVPLDLTRLGDSMLTTNPRQLKTNAHQLREITAGNTSIRTAIALMTLYNKTAGRRILVSNKTFTGKRREAGV